MGDNIGSKKKQKSEKVIGTFARSLDIEILIHGLFVLCMKKYIVNLKRQISNQS